MFSPDKTTEDQTVYLTTPLSKAMYDALTASYEAKRKYAKANLAVYFSNPAGIGEHSDILAEIDIHLATIADADGKLFALDNDFAKGNAPDKGTQSTSDSTMLRS